MEDEYIDYGNYKVQIIAVITGLAIIIASIYIIMDLLTIQMQLISKIVIIAMAIMFLWEKVIDRIAGWVTKLMSNISKGQKLGQAISETIEKTTEEDIARDKKDFKRLAIMKVEKDLQKERNK